MMFSIATSFFDAFDRADRAADKRVSLKRYHIEPARAPVSPFPPAIILAFCGLSLVALIFGHPQASADMIILSGP